MNCCDYDCHQGRDCPARKPVCKHCYGTGYDASSYPCTCRPADVAKVGRKLPADRPLLADSWRKHLRPLSTWVLSVIGLLVYAALLSAVLS